MLQRGSATHSRVARLKTRKIGRNTIKIAGTKFEIETPASKCFVNSICWKNIWEKYSVQITAWKMKRIWKILQNRSVWIIIVNFPIDIYSFLLEIDFELEKTFNCRGNSDGYGLKSCEQECALNWMRFSNVRLKTKHTDHDVTSGGLKWY